MVLSLGRWCVFGGERYCRGCRTSPVSQLSSIGHGGQHNYGSTSQRHGSPNMGTIIESAMVSDDSIILMHADSAL